MNEHALKLLEFNRILELLGNYCLSEQGRRLLFSQEISNEPQIVKQRKGLTTAFRKLLAAGERFPELHFPDISVYYDRLYKKGSFLEPEELLDIANYLLSAKKLKLVIVRSTEDQALLDLTAPIPDLDSVVKAIFKVVDRYGNIKDDKIPALVKIKNTLKNLRESVNSLARHWINHPDYKTCWQTDTATTRDGRIVLPLKANFKGRIKGVIHESSGSGATLFIEPLDLVEKNNAITEWENAYRRELIKLLQETTAVVIDDINQVKTACEQVSLLDTYYAKARYSLHYNGVPADHSNKAIKLINARHPLIKQKVVPITIDMADDIRVLIITGPNTGGKTVSLKTAGLLGLMNQFGMEIPADEGSSLPLFDCVLADIGDEQSIEQSLSTFSGHIQNLSRIIGASTGHSLVLLDELGAGTDPEEGVAIAMALLDHFIEKGCTVLSTTHHGILKNYGYTRDGVENASMDFDESTLSPRYKLLMGLPGESHALSIASRNGIPQVVIEKARSYLDDERSDISELIKRLAEKQKKLIEHEQEHEQRKNELTEKERMTELKELRLRQKELEVSEYSVKELKRFLADSRKELENMIRRLREEELTRENIKEVHAYLSAIEEKVSTEEKKYEKKMKVQYLEPGVALEPGMEVIIKSTRKNGQLLRKGKGDAWLIKTGSMKVMLNPHEFSPVASAKHPTEVEVLTTAGPADTQAVFTLNLIGLRLDEAIAKLERQIDAAVIKGLKEFNVIHGKGDGILQKGIHQYLKHCAFIEDYFFSTPEGGGFGRTIVILKS